MKKISIAFIIGLMSFSAFAEGTFVQCDMEIKKNKTSLDDLKTSKKRVRFSIEPGQTVVLDNDVVRIVPYADDNQKYRKHQIAVFKGDEKIKKISSDIPYARVPIKNPVEVTLHDNGSQFIFTYDYGAKGKYTVRINGEPPLRYKFKDPSLFKFKYTPFDHEFFSMKNNHIWGKAKKGAKLSATHTGKIVYECRFAYDEFVDVEDNGIGEDLTEVEEFEIKRNPKKTATVVEE